MNCEHIKEIKDVNPKTENCEECEKLGLHWVELRLCLTCGHVGCCDSSEGKHARKHFEETKHPIIKSLPLSDNSWIWCYVDNDYVKK